MTMLDGVRINQLSDEATTWLAGMLRALDAKDVDAYTHYMADDVEVVFNNGEMTMRGASRSATAWQSSGRASDRSSTRSSTSTAPTATWCMSAEPLHDSRRAQADHQGRRLDRPRCRRPGHVAAGLHRSEPAVSGARGGWALLTSPPRPALSTTRRAG